MLLRPTVTKFIQRSLSRVTLVRFRPRKGIFPINPHLVSRPTFSTLCNTFSTCSVPMAAQQPTDEEKKKEPEWREYLGQKESQEFDNSLFFEYEFSIDQLMEIAGLCVAQAVARCYPLQEGTSSRVLVVCGPGNNGGDGLVAARHLLFFGYEPVIFYPKKTSKEIYQILVSQCEKLNITFLSSLPPLAEIDSQYLVVVDAIFGFSFKGSARPPFDTVLADLKKITKPIASVDIPSGWDVEKGNVDGVGLNPDLLVSLTAPKLCSKAFSGRYHYLGLRMIPKELADKYRIKLPQYPGTEQIVQIK